MSCKRMARLLLNFLLYCGISAGAQYPGQSLPPGGTTPPTFPDDSRGPSSIPPDTRAPTAQSPSSEEIRDQIQQKLDTQRGLENTELNVAVDSAQVTVNGVIQREAQRDLVLRIVNSYAGEREIVDRLQIGNAPVADQEP